MSNRLEEIVANSLLQTLNRKAAADYPMLERMASHHRPRGFAAALRAARATGPAIIAELKKASPSRGLIRDSYVPAALARSLQQAGATALSVLTNEAFFQGSLEHLEAASAAVTIPCIRKDFIVDPFQILEARAAGADAVLLIVAALTDNELLSLRKEAYSMGLDVLCEVHDREEIERAIDLGCEAMGVNSRDLKTMTVRPETQMELAKWLPGDAVRVAESGIRSAADLARLQSVGYDAFLIGEALMRQPDPAGALALMLDRDYEVEVRSGWTEASR